MNKHMHKAMWWQRFVLCAVLKDRPAVVAARRPTPVCPAKAIENEVNTSVLSRQARQSTAQGREAAGSVEKTGGVEHWGGGSGEAVKRQG